MTTRTELPSNIDLLSKDEIIRLLKRVADERDDALLETINSKGKKRQKISSQAAVSHSVLLPTPPVGGYATLGAVYGSSSSTVPVGAGGTLGGSLPTYGTSSTPVAIAAGGAGVTAAGAGAIQITPSILVTKMSINFDVVDTKKRILKNATQRIKKTVHTDRNKPYTEVVECVPNESSVLLLMNGFVAKSHRHSMMKWQLNEQQVIEWLTMYDAPYIHPVTNKINTICLFGEKPNLYVHAKIESCEIKWERKSGSFNLRFRTMVAGYGKPPYFQPSK